MSGDNDTDYSIFRDDVYKRRRRSNQNIVKKLIHRETFQIRPNTNFHVARSFTLNVFPNFTVTNVEKPPCFLRKFSPDGHHFVAFSRDQSSIEIYEFQGPCAVEKLLHKACTGVPEDIDELKANMFDHFFKQKAVVTVASYGEHLNRECSLFTDDGKFVIIGSASAIPEDFHPLFYDIYRNNESVAPNARSPLEDYSIHVVDLCHGKLHDSRAFKCDKIFLSHNQGIYLYKDLLAVLSVQHQTIHIFQVTPEGYFVDVRVIGRFCHEDDHYLVNRLTDTSNTRPFRDKCFNSLKHRLLTYLYRYSSQDGSKESIRRFYQYFDQFKNLRMWKMQLLDESHLLIKYAAEDVVTLKAADPNSQASFFAVYNMSTTEIVAIYRNTSEELLDIFEQFNDHFRNALPHQVAQFSCSTSSNIYARYNQRRFKSTIINAKYGGHKEAVKRLLAQLPISSQSYSSSPFLDLSLFSYDDKWVSVMERPKGCGDHPIRFYCRDTGLLKYKIYAGVHGRALPPTGRRLVAFTFHPFYPFAISVQRNNTEYIVNFHLRHFTGTSLDHL
ncbi:DET1 homolog [Hydractinia symbiolongicarpus]|uniref:DET1 homolog n=1 Tax=Hydractinia symbiolongicarpus TaxID=13093 RepID=UPI00254FDBDF|nr:DET1 homolog [Hydractinia symbiolongicarpus]XP_057291123.1 DET1 homolog [Hydractinia symbiolongicarpus]XP_057291124.1 DET1 homolog [Hydractinia symbiolongicarpus]XP_057291125.1 DET1 homolog [Hydractinia symbiolongicarpus]